MMVEMLRGTDVYNVCDVLLHTGRATYSELTNGPAHKTLGSICGSNVGEKED